MDKYIGFDVDSKKTVACIIQRGGRDRYATFKTDRNFVIETSEDCVGLSKVFFEGVRVVCVLGHISMAFSPGRL